MTLPWSEGRNKTIVKNKFNFIFVVGRAASGKLGDFAKVVEVEYLKSDLVPMFVNLAQDDQVGNVSLFLSYLQFTLWTMIPSIIY